MRPISIRRLVTAGGGERGITKGRCIADGVGPLILGALVPVGGFDGADWPTLDLSPLGRRRRHRRNPLLAREAG